MKQANRLGKLLVFSAALGSIGQAQAQVTFLSNLEAPSGEGAGTIGSNSWWAQGVTAPESGEFALGSVSLRLYREETEFSGTFNVSFWNAAGPEGLPGSAITTVASAIPVSSLTPTLTDYRFDLANPVALTPAQPYYVVVSSSASSVNAGLYWSATQGANPPWTGPGQIGSWTTSADQGANWDFLDAQFPLQLALATPVPEPEFYALFAGLGMLGFAAFRRWRRVVQPV
jgi:hypothetical protein